jgi:cysteine desulfurase/selenocysteine lyase
VRRDFPILSERVHGKPLVYLDSANTESEAAVGASTRWTTYYRHANANIIARRISERTGDGTL